MQGLFGDNWMIVHFLGWMNESSYCFEIEYFEVINPDVNQCNELINDLECMVYELTKRRDVLKEL